VYIKQIPTNAHTYYQVTNLLRIYVTPTWFNSQRVIFKEYICYILAASSTKWFIRRKIKLGVCRVVCTAAAIWLLLGAQYIQQEVGGPQSRSARSEEETNLLALSGFEPRTVQPVSGQDAGYVITASRRLCSPNLAPIFVLQFTMSSQSRTAWTTRTLALNRPRRRRNWHRPASTATTAAPNYEAAERCWASWRRAEVRPSTCWSTPSLCE